MKSACVIATVGAARKAWIAAHGPIPAGLEVMHDCDNPPCRNLEHVRLGTHADNMRDKAEKGRAPRLTGERNGRARLSEHDARTLRRRRLAGEPLKTLAAEYGISRMHVWEIATGRKWKCLSSEVS